MCKKDTEHKTLGRLHSIDSMGLADGPGIRFVAFFQGCQLRCRYCHNPDTWAQGGGFEIEAEALVKKAERFKNYFGVNGGVTCSGGEPLLQPDFLIEFLKACKASGIHTALDTSGVGVGRYEEILSLADLVILDIKHVSSEGFKSLAGEGYDEFKRFSKVLNGSGKPIWLRHVVVPGITDGETHLSQLAEIMQNYQNVERIELLPYHTMGAEKYDALGIPYTLKEIPPMDRTQTRYMEDDIRARCKVTQQIYQSNFQKGV